MSSPSTSSSMSSPSLFHGEESCVDPLKPNSEPENPRIDIWIGSASVSSVSNCCNLDMCTETLGFENGAMCFNCEMEIDAERKKRPPVKQGRSAATVFPPPLTTLRGKETLILRRRREEGRLLLIVFRPLVVEAERSGGRLVLRMPARRGLKEKGKEEEGRKVEEEAEKEELVVNCGCGGKYWSVAARFGSDALLLAR
ncbi:hypothetical protein IEQ34_000788 [Dendrobium chrysotoxum]|uniref:FAF domain-containing protein n=1 Tax=Dendrobium chrysotoxum TaxID=161865 RepID=A0AAV7HV98_DENCH|nr:hypothetical protein IEQ34_000788 [Dendrobium chrysotoxum]